MVGREVAHVVDRDLVFRHSRLRRRGERDAGTGNRFDCGGLDGHPAVDHVVCRIRCVVVNRAAEDECHRLEIDGRRGKQLGGFSRRQRLHIDLQRLDGVLARVVGERPVDVCRTGAVADADASRAAATAAPAIESKQDLPGSVVVDLHGAVAATGGHGVSEIVGARRIRNALCVAAAVVARPELDVAAGHVRAGHDVGVTRYNGQVRDELLEYRTAGYRRYADLVDVRREGSHRRPHVAEVTVGRLELEIVGHAREIAHGCAMVFRVGDAIEVAGRGGDVQ